MTPYIRRAFTLAGCAIVLAALGSTLLAQVPRGMPADQASMYLAQNAALVRQRLQQSGLTQAQIQQRLQAAGYPPNLLDAYITPGVVGGAEAPALDQQAFSAMATLGVDAFPSSVTRVADSTVARLGPDTSVVGGVPLRLFGLNVLRQPSTSLQPVTGPVDDAYPLGPGDQIVLFLTGGVQDTHVLDVTNQGFVVIPRVGQIYVNSLTLGQLRNVLYTKLAEVYSGISRSPDARTRFDLAITKIRVQSIRVVGDVTKPGTYQIAATGGVLSAIYEAGGLTELGNFRSVEIHRGAKLVGTADLYDYLLKGIVGSEPRLESGDVVFVPTHGPRIRVAGEVMRPGIYEIKANETLRDAIRVAGGLSPWAATESATIDRLLPPDQRPAPGYIRTVLTANLREVRDSSAAPTALFAEDSITVLRVTGGRRASVAVDGSVWQPATYALTPGMRLWDLIRAAHGLRTDTYGGRVQVLRTLPDSTKFLLGFELDSSNATNNPALQESDRVTVFATTDFRPVRYVTVYGAVPRPGMVAFADSMKLRDAILLAGGLREDAYLGEAEVSRLKDHRGSDGDSLAVILRVTLDSSYVVDSSGYIRRAVGQRSSPDVVLSPYDNVFVRNQPGWELQRNVALGGEVKFPGRYTLATKDERIGSLIARAGGLTPNAYAEGFQMYRRGHEGASQIAVDLPRIMRDGRFKDNLVLAAGDSLYVPSFMPTVRVEGAVNLPTTVTFVQNAGLGYYVDAAGGFTAQADRKRAFVQQANGFVEKGRHPGPGATVIVPKRDPNERRAIVELMPLFTAAVQVMAASVTLIIALRR